MPNKSEKMQNFKNTLIVFGLIILFIGCFLLAVITPFAITLYDKVASADSTDGVVEDNLLLDNDFDIGPSSGQGWIGNSKWWLGQSNSQGSFINHTLSGTNNTGYVNIRQWCDGIDKGVDLHFRVQTSSHTGNWLVQVWLYNDKNGSPSQGYTTGWFDADFKEGTFQLSTSYEYAMFVIQCRQSISLDYVKLEYGTSFTGYVPKDYTNYGYTQGYNDGTQDTIVTFDTIRGYKILGATTYWFNDVLFAGHHYLDRPDPSLSTVYVNKLSFFEYNGVAYELYNDNQSSPSYIPFNFLPNYEYSIFPISLTGYATVPIGINIGYVSGPVYLCSDYSFYENNVQIVVRRHDGTSTIFIDQFTVSAYYNDIPVMDLSPYLQGGFFYDFYMCSKTKGTGAGNTSTFTLQTHNTYFTGINSICLITIDNSDVLGASSYEEGRRKGYDAGREAGYWEGYGVGYSQGELVAPAEGQYTFLGVIGALFDAPIGALSSFLNFDLLGFNMRSFFFALISLAFIILVLRIVLGSKL